MNQPATTATASLPADRQAAADTARQLIAESLAPNTRRAYRSAFAALRTFAGNAKITDAALAAYVGHVQNAGRTAASAATAIAAAKLAAKESGQPSPAGELTRRALAGMRRRQARAEHRPAGARGQSSPVGLEDACAMLAVAGQPQRRGRGIESPNQAAARARTDRAIVSLLFMGGLRRSEAAAVWADVSDADNSGLIVRLGASKTNQDGSAADSRYLKNGFAAAVRELRAAGPADPAAPVIGLSAAQIGRRFQALARLAGIDGRITSHSGRIGLAVELTRRGAPTAAVQLAGGWKSGRMVAHYSSAVAAESGAVARYL